MLILNAGSGGLVSNFRPILAGLKDRFNLTACVTDPYYGQNAVQDAMENIGKSFVDVMLLLLIGKGYKREITDLKNCTVCCKT